MEEERHEEYVDVHVWFLGALGTVEFMLGSAIRGTLIRIWLGDLNIQTNGFFEGCVVVREGSFLVFPAFSYLLEEDLFHPYLFSRDDRLISSSKKPMLVK